MSADSYYFTPVRRREFLLQPEDDKAGSQPWTATRCHRFLRALKSRVEILRKHSSHFPTALGELSKYTSEADEKSSTTNERDLCQNRPVKRIRRTYAGRGRAKPDQVRADCSGLKSWSRNANTKNTGLSFIPGEISVPTPILNRASTGHYSPQRSDTGRSELARENLIRGVERRCATKDGKILFELKEAMRELRRTVSTDHYTLYVGIYNALDALLKATNSSSPKTELAGKRSLLSMCLRNIPRLIDQEENLEALYAAEHGRKSAIDVREISSEVYLELESLGSSGKGWKHLRTVVRAHGVQIICKALVEGLVDHRFVNILVMLCVHLGSIREAETILSTSLITCQYPEPKSLQSRFSEDPKLFLLAALDGFARCTGRIHFYHEQLGNLFASNKLPIAWLASKELSLVWTNIFRSISVERYSHKATCFLANTLQLMFEVGARDGRLVRMPELLSDAFSSVLAILCALCVLDHNSEAKTAELCSRHSKIIALLTTVTIECGGLSSTVCSKQAALLCVSNLLLQPNASTAELISSTLFSSNFGGGYNQAREDIATFLSSVAHNCGRGVSTDGFEHLKLMIDRLLSMANSDRCQPAQELSGAIIDSAYAFARDRLDRGRLEFAEDLEKKLGGHPAKPGLSIVEHQSVMEIRFRWEDGISEWVTSTPAIAESRRDLTKHHMWDMDSDCDSPLRPSPKRRRQSISLPHMCQAICHSKSLRKRVSDLVPSSPVTVYGDNEIQEINQFPSAQRERVILLHRRSSSYSQHDRQSIRVSKSITKIPRLGREVLHSNQSWKLFDDSDSDDELNSDATSAYCDLEILQDLPNLSNIATQKIPLPVSTSGYGKLSTGWPISHLLDSEDELVA